MKIDVPKCFEINVVMLNYGFCKKSLRKNATLNSWPLFSLQKSTCIGTVQLFRVAFFQSDFLQNPYFSWTNNFVKT